MDSTIAPMRLGGCACHTARAALSQLASRAKLAYQQRDLGGKKVIETDQILKCYLKN